MFSSTDRGHNRRLRVSDVELPVGLKRHADQTATWTRRSTTENVNHIARVIVPALIPGGEATFGMSDILFSAFLSPAQPRVAIWGIGPALLLPVSSDPFLGTEKWAAGPTFVILK